MVRIPGSHPGGPGSIPGMGSNCSFICSILVVFATAGCSSITIFSVVAVYKNNVAKNKYGGDIISVVNAVE